MTIKDYIVVALTLAGLFYTSAVARIYFFEDELVFNIFTKQRVTYYLVILAVVIVAFKVKERFPKNKNLLKCVLLTASFFLILYLVEYYDFANERGGSFGKFVKVADYSLLFFLSVLGLLTFIFKMGFGNFFYPDKTEEERLLPDQGAENIVPGYKEDYAVCENCQRASIDINASTTQCPLCKAKFAYGELVTE